MAIIVQKYGGTSVANIDRINLVAKRVAKIINQGDHPVVVLSAMAGTTDRLIALAEEAAGENLPSQRETDVLLATGEQTTIALLAIVLKSMGYKAESVLGYQANIRTNNVSSNALIENIKTDKIDKLINEGIIPIIAGFQGCDDNNNITTLGRGGSDTSAVAVAVAIKADVCEILTDVLGVYTTNPKDCSKAKKIDQISFEDMLELSSLGAKVLHSRSVELAKKYDLPIHLRSSFSDKEGTMIINGEGIENPVVSGISCKIRQSQITLKGMENYPGIAADIFEPFYKAGIPVDMITQPYGVNGDDAKTNLSFTIETANVEESIILLKWMAKDFELSSSLAKVSVVGSGMKGKAGVASKMFRALGDSGINILLISTSEIRISVIIDDSDAKKAINVLHSVFGLDQE